MKIYLAGSVPKGDVEAKTYRNWREEYSEVLKNVFDDVECINPMNRNVDESDFFDIFGGDSIDIRDSDLVVVFAEEKLSVGTSQEFLIAKYFKKPVVCVLPKNTYHRRVDLLFNGKIINDWIHPFVFATSDFIIESIEEIEDIKDDIFNSQIKGIDIIDKAILYSKKLREKRKIDNAIEIDNNNDNI